jgi:hypothetical protein
MVNEWVEAGLNGYLIALFRTASATPKVLRRELEGLE